MSFSSQVKNELNSAIFKNNCCKKAYIYGAILPSLVEGEKLSLTISDAFTVEKLRTLLNVIYKIEPEIKDVSRGCFKATELVFESAKLADYLRFADAFSDSEEDGDTIDSYFGCQECKIAFVKGLFCAKGSMSDPQKGYSFEIQLPNDTRAFLAHAVMETVGSEAPGITVRKGKWGLFYKNESAIEDILNACGAVHSLYQVMNSAIEKNLRNEENRATNCVMRNIKKSVNAAASQITAIEAILASGMDCELSDDLKTTAALRIEHPEASLGELAEMHVPAISKSGLNHRLQKLMDFAKQSKLI